MHIVCRHNIGGCSKSRQARRYITCVRGCCDLHWLRGMPQVLYDQLRCEPGPRKGPRRSRKAGAAPPKTQREPPVQTASNTRCVHGWRRGILLLLRPAWMSSCTLFLSAVQVMEDSRIRAATEPLLLHKNWVVATLVFVLWCSGLLLLESWLLSKFGPPQLQQWQLAVLGGSAGVFGVAFGVWALLRMRHERQRRAALEEAGGADALLFGHALSSSDDEEGRGEV